MKLTKRVNESRLDEKSYRELKGHINYSGLKLFWENRKKFFDEYIMGTPRVDKKTVSKTLGSLVHAILASEFDDKFVLAQGIPPTGQILELTETLFEITIKNTDENGVQTQRFEIMFEEAFNRVKYDYSGAEVAFKGKTIDKAVEMFTGTDKKSGACAETYYQEMLRCIGKEVISVATATQGEKLVDKLKTHPHTKDIVNQESTDEIEVFSELPILFMVDGVPFRILPDRLIVNHIQKTVNVYDWKTGWDVEDGGFERTVLKNCYYLQISVYDRGIREWMKEHGLEDYKLNPMTYVAIDVKGWLDPIVYQASHRDVINGWSGFRSKGYYYPGAKELTDEIHWYLDNGNWSSCKQAVENGGSLPLNIEYN